MLGRITEAMFSPCDRSDVVSHVDTIVYLLERITTANVNGN